MSPSKKRFTEDFISKWSKASGEKETSGKKALLQRQRELLRKNPDNARLLMAHGEALQDVGKYDESLEYLKKAQEMDAGLPGIQLSIAKSQLYSGDTEAATASLLKSFVDVCEKNEHPYLQIINSPDTLVDIVGRQHAALLSSEDELADLELEPPSPDTIEAKPAVTEPEPAMSDEEAEPSFEEAEARRRKKAVTTLTAVPGIGHLKAEVLYDAGFRSVEDLIDASVEELSEVEGIGEKTAQKIKIVVTFEARAEEGASDAGIPDLDVLSDELDEIECPLCKTIMPASSTVCYECGMKFKEEDEEELDDDLHHKLKECEATLAADPSDIEAWYEKGEVLHVMGRSEEALEAFNEVTKLDANYPGVWNMKAEVFTKMGEHQKAASCYKRAMELGITTAVSAQNEEMEELLQELETFQDDSEIDKEAWQGEQAKIQRELRELSDREVASELGLDLIDDEIDDDDAELFDSLTKSLDRADTPPKPKMPELEDDDVKQMELITKGIDKKSASISTETLTVGEEDSDDIEYITKPVGKEAASRPTMEVDVTDEEAKRIEAVTRPLVGKSPETKDRGMTNGLSRGMTNGLAKKGFVNGTGRTNGLTNGMGRTNGLTNGQGRTNGLTNGVGRTNGLTNGLGKTNGLTNGVGHTNGLTNGLGRTNGLTNGVGATNGLTNGMGHTNGLTNGVTNGLTNGLRALRGGMTNGLTNGTGLTNGLGGRRFSYEIRKNKWKLYVIPLVTVLLLIVPMLTPTTVEVEEYPIIIDGDFADWAAFESSASSGATGSFNTNVDIIASTAENNNDRYLAFYVEVAGTMLAGEPVTSAGYMDFFHFFIDIDNDATTGFYIDGIGADYMEEVRGWNGGVDSATLYSFASGHDTSDWNGFRVIGSTRASVASDSLETQIAWATFDLDGPADVAVLVHSQSYDGYQDYSDTLISNSMTVVSGVQVSVAPQTMSGTGQLLRIDMTAVNADATLNGVTVEILGSILPAEISTVRIENSGGTSIGAATPASRSVTLAMGDTVIPAGTTASFYIEADVPAGTAIGKTVGFDLLAIDVFNGTASFSRETTLQDMAYVDVIPAGVMIDGGFSDWASNFQIDDVGETETAGTPNIDISRFGAANDGIQLTFYMMTSGNMMGGASVPFEGRVQVPAGTEPGPTAEPDSDGDGLKNSEEPGFEYDFDNDGIPDSQDDDKDNDGILDYGSGGNDTELVQNETKAYKYIGPIEAPPENGYDTARFYVDSDNDTATGYSIGDIGADYLLEFRGKYGRVLEASQHIFAGTNQGSWSWTYQSEPAYGSDSRQLEASLDVATLNQVDAYFEMESWNENSDDAETPSTRAGTRSVVYPPSLEDIGIEIPSNNQIIEEIPEDYVLPELIYAPADSVNNSEKLEDSKENLTDNNDDLSQSKIGKLGFSSEEPIITQTPDNSTDNLNALPPDDPSSTQNGWTQWNSEYDGSGYVGACEVDDLDGDGNPEFFWGDSTGYAHAHEYGGTANTVPSATWSSNDIGYGPSLQGIAIGDADTDGKKEILTADWDSDVDLYEYSGTGGISATNPSTTPTVSLDVDGDVGEADADPLGVTTGDVDNDGNGEVWVSYGYNGLGTDRYGSCWYEETGDDTYAYRGSWYSSGTTGQPCYTIKTSGTGSLDGTDSGNNYREFMWGHVYILYIYENTGSNTFIQRAAIQPVVAYIYSIEVYDLDGDGTDEIFYVAGANLVIVYSTADNTYTSSTIALSDTGFEVVGGDINGGSERELYIAMGGTADRVECWNYTGTGWTSSDFTVTTIFSSDDGDDVYGIAIADLDYDGDGSYELEIGEAGDTTASDNEVFFIECVIIVPEFNNTGMVVALTTILFAIGQVTRRKTSKRKKRRPA